MSTERKLTIGNGVEITEPEWIINHIQDYLSFTDAAKMINPRWTRHHLHKEMQMGRVFRAEVLIIQDLTTHLAAGFASGKKYYITKMEMLRLKAEYEKRPKRKIQYCIFECGRQSHTCIKDPCIGRRKDGKQFRETVEDAAEYFERFRTKAGTRKRHFSAFNRRGERKSFGNSKRESNGGDNVPT